MCIDHDLFIIIKLCIIYINPLHVPSSGLRGVHWTQGRHDNVGMFVSILKYVAGGILVCYIYEK